MPTQYYDGVDFKDGDYSTPWRQRGPWLGGKSQFHNTRILGEWFKNYATSQGVDQNTLAYLNNLSDAELGSLLEEFWTREDEILGDKYDRFSTADALKELKALSSINLPEPSKSYEDLYNEMSAKIDEENAAANSLYDQALASQRGLYNSQMNLLNSGYNNLAKQTLAMDYQKNNQLLGGLENSMSKARQNALEAGASAGIRLANNVNTLMSTQNQQAMQSLQTSNNLAQMLMNQQQAAAGLKSNLANAYSTNANQKAGLIQGTYERKQSNADSAWRINQDIYDDKVNRATSGLEGNTFKDSYLKFKQGQTGGTQQSGSSPY